MDTALKFKAKPKAYKPLSPIFSSALLSKELAKEIVGNVFFRKKRQKKIVDHEYNLGHWQSVLKRQDWLRHNSIQEYLTSNSKTTMHAKIHNRRVQIQSTDYYSYKIELLYELLAVLSGQSDELVELGCGFGWNLFALSSLGKWATLTGYDISENGLTVGREVAKHYGLNNIQFNRLDLTQKDDPSYKKLEGKTIFSHYCFEQIKYDLPSVIQNLIDNKVARVINIETCAGSIDPTSPQDWLTYLYIRRQDYQKDLKRILVDFEARGKIRIIHMERLYYSPTIKNDPELFCWEPI